MNIDLMLEQYLELETKQDTLNRTIISLDDQIRFARRAVRKELEINKKILKANRKLSTEKLEGVIDTYLSKLVIVPGNEAIFEQLECYKVEVVNIPNRTNKGVILAERIDFERSLEFKDSTIYVTSPSLLLKNKIVGIINAQLVQSGWTNYSRGDMYIGTDRLYYGLPVRKKE